MIDHTIYATFIDKLNEISVEGKESDLFFKEPVRNIYHFGELWYTAFFTWLYKHNTLQVFYFSVFPNLLSTLVIGGRAIIEHFQKKKKWYYWLQPFSLIILSGIVFYFPKSFEFFSLSWGNDTILSCIKYSPLAIFMLGAFFLILEKKHYNAILLMLACTLINTATSPAIFIGLMIYLFILILTKELKKKEIFAAFISFLLSGLFLLSYSLFINFLNKKYLSFNNSYETSYSISDKLRDIMYYKTLFNCTFGTLLKFILSSIPFVGLIIFAGKKWVIENKFFLLFGLSFVLSSAISYGIFHFDFDGTQFWTVVYIPLMSIFLYIIIISTNCFKPTFTIKAYTYFLFMLLFYPYLFIKNSGWNFIQNTSSIRYLTDNISPDNKKNIAVFYPKSIPKHVAGYDKNIYYPYGHMKLYIDNYHPYCLSEFDTMLSRDTYIRNYQVSYLKRSIFFRFVEKQKKQHVFNSIEQSQLDFIKEARVKYVLTQSGATLPGLIMPFVEKQITDTLSPSSKDKLYILKDF